MGTHVIRMPDIEGGIVKAELAEWHVQAGDSINGDQVLAEVMTDRVTVEIPSSMTGRILAFGGQPGQVMAVGGELTRLEVESADNLTESPAAMAPAVPAAVAPEEPKEIPVVPPKAAAEAPRTLRDSEAPWQWRQPGERPLASPAARQRARDPGIELQLVQGSGPAERTLHEDLNAYLTQGGNVVRSGDTAQGYAKRHDEQAVPVIGLRHEATQKMQGAKRHIPYFSYVEEVDVTDLEALRTYFNQKWGGQRGKLTLLPLLVRAVVVALCDSPQLNVRCDDEAEVAIRYGAVHTGIATQSDDGLMVPVLCHTKSHDLWDNASEVAYLAEVARSNKTQRQKLPDSTTTLSSLGALGRIVSIPVINHPEVAIVGVNHIVERPVVVDGNIVVCEMMSLFSPFDHRVVSRMNATTFTQAVRSLLEHPVTLFLEQAVGQVLKIPLLIVDGGPGGYVAAIRAGQLGIPTVLAGGAALGGTCLNVGCIPPKALIHAAEEYLRARHYIGRSALGIQVQAPSIDITRTVEQENAIADRLTSGVAALLKKHGADVVQSWARILSGKSAAVRLTGGGSRRIECGHLLLAVGSQSVKLPILSLGGKIISSIEALASGSPPKRLVVVGGGYIGLELGTAYHKLGVGATVMEAQPRILPGYDEELIKPVAQALHELGVELYLGYSLLGPSRNGVRVRNGVDEEREIAVDQALVVVGRKPHSEDWNLESLGLDMNGRAVKVDDQCRTSMRSVRAIGNPTGGPILAYRAMTQDETIAELIAGKRRQSAPVTIFAVCFADPEVVAVRLSPEQAKDASLDCLVASPSFATNGRAMTLEANEGFARVVARRDDHLVIGWQAMGKAVSELSAAFVQSLEMGARLEDIVDTIHAHPIFGEAVQEAALRALGHALHI